MDSRAVGEIFLLQCSLLGELPLGFSCRFHAPLAASLSEHMRLSTHLDTSSRMSFWMICSPMDTRVVQEIFLLYARRFAASFWLKEMKLVKFLCWLLLHHLMVLGSWCWARQPIFASWCAGRCKVGSDFVVLEFQRICTFDNAEKNLVEGMSVLQMTMRYASKRKFVEKLSRFGVGCAAHVEQHLVRRSGFRTGETSRKDSAELLTDKTNSCASPHPVLKLACRQLQSSS